MRTLLIFLLVAVATTLCVGCGENDATYKGRITDVLYEFYDSGDKSTVDGLIEIISTPKESKLSVKEHVLFKTMPRETVLSVGDTIYFSLIELNKCEKTTVSNITVEQIIEIELYK